MSGGSYRWSEQRLKLLQQWESLLQVGKQGWSPMLYTLSRKCYKILGVVNGLDASLH